MPPDPHENDRPEPFSSFYFQGFEEVQAPIKASATYDRITANFPRLDNSLFLCEIPISVGFLICDTLCGR